MTSPEWGPQAGDPRAEQRSPGSSSAVAPQFWLSHISSYIALEILYPQQLQLSLDSSNAISIPLPVKGANGVLLLQISRCLSIPCLLLNFALNSIICSCITLFSFKLLEKILSAVRAMTNTGTQQLNKDGSENKCEKLITNLPISSKYLIEALNSVIMSLHCQIEFLNRQRPYIWELDVSAIISYYFFKTNSFYKNMSDSFKSCVQINMFIFIFLNYHKNGLSCPSFLQNMSTSLFLQCL